MKTNEPLRPLMQPRREIRELVEDVPIDLSRCGRCVDGLNTPHSYDDTCRLRPDHEKGKAPEKGTS